MQGFTIASYIHFLESHLDDKNLMQRLFQLERDALGATSRSALLTRFLGWRQDNPGGRCWCGGVPGVKVPGAGFLSRRQ